MSSRTIWALAIILLLTSANIHGQEQVSSDTLLRQRAAQELDSVLAEAGSVADKNDSATVRARAASLVWLQNPERARELFSSLWAWVNSQDDVGFDREAARLQILKCLYARDAKFATKLLKTLDEETPGDGSREAGGKNVHRLNALASGLIKDDPSTAAGLLGESLSAETSAENVALLGRLRKRDVGLADGAALRALTSLKSRPAAQALLPAYSLVEYVVSTTPQTGAGPVNMADEAFRRQFYATAYGILQQTLQGSERQAVAERSRPDNNSSFKTFVQSQLAGVLATLANRYAPERAVELGALAAKLSAGVPPQLNELSQYTLDRMNGRQYKPKDDSPAVSLPIALSTGDFDEAKRLLGKLENEGLKKLYSFEISTKEFEADMAHSNFAGALAVAKGVEDTPARAFMFAQVAKAAYKKGDTLTPQLAISEARDILQKADCEGKKVVAMFALATASAPISVSDSVEFLNGGTTCMNTPRASGSSAAKDAADTRRKFTDLQELQQAFSSLGRVDLDNALLSAGKIDDKPTALIARLSACETWLRAAGNTKAAPAGTKQVK